MATKKPEVLVDPIHSSVVLQLRHPVQSTPTCPVNISSQDLTNLAKVEEST